MAVYDTLHWRIVRSRALQRDGGRCTVSRLLGGPCSPGPLHVHHIIPLAEGGPPFDLDNVGTACAAHHMVWEALRRALVDRLAAGGGRPRERCPHRHRTPEGRRLCEARRAREAAAVV